jgi:putative ABC transport system permease protein
MYNTLNMAFRNIGRNKRRSLLAAFSVFIAILSVVFADGFISGILDSVARNITRTQTGHVSIETEEYRSRERFMPAQAALRDADAIVKSIEENPDLKGRLGLVAPRVQFGVILSSDTGTKTALGIGGDPEKEKRLLMLDTAIVPGGKYPEHSGEAIVGWKLASDLGLGVGDKLKVVTEKADYGLGYKKFVIVGLYKTNIESFDGASFQIHIDDARDLLGIGRGASRILVMLDDYRKADSAAFSIKEAFKSEKGLSIKSWTEISDMAAMITMSEGIFLVLEIFIAFLGAFIIANIMMMVVLERRREIGILKALGMQNGRILGLFLSEGTLLGTIGSVAGALVGAILTVWLGVSGIDLTGLSAGTDFQMDNVVYPAVHPLRIVVFVAMGMLVSAIISYLPSKSAADLDPIEAIRSV